MKQLRTLVLAVAASVTAMALGGPGPASATVLCEENLNVCPEASAYKAGTTIGAALTAGGSLRLGTTGEFVLGECSSVNIAGLTANKGGTEERVKVETLTFDLGGCSSPTSVLEFGPLEFEYFFAENKTRANLHLRNTRITATSFGSSCVYGTGASSNIGTAEGGSPGQVSVLAVLPRISGGFFCPPHVVVKGTLEFTAPKPLYFKDKAE